MVLVWDIQEYLKIQEYIHVQHVYIQKTFSSFWCIFNGVGFLYIDIFVYCAFCSNIRFSSYNFTVNLLWFACFNLHGNIRQTYIGRFKKGWNIIEFLFIKSLQSYTCNKIFIPNNMVWIFLIFLSKVNH